MAELLKSAEVAALLRVHPKQIYRLLKQGLPGQRVGGEWRFSVEDVLRWGAARGHGTALSPAPPSPSPSPSLPSPSVPLAPRPPPLLAANGDLLVEILLGNVAARGALLGFVQADAATALEALGAHRVLLAGYHAEAPPSHLEAARLARIHLAVRDVGLAHPSTKKVRGIADLARTRLALRPATAGVRRHFDRALVAARRPLTDLDARVGIHASHREAVCAVLRGEADVALTTRAWAARVGLRFFPLATESYDLLLFAEHLGTPAVVALAEVAQDKAFRAALAAVPGYDPDRAGQIRYDFPDPPSGR